MDTVRGFAVALMIAAVFAYADTPLDLPTTDTGISIRETTDASKSGKSFIATSVMHSSVDHVCRTILSYSDYPSFMSNIEQVRVRETNATSAVLDMKLKLPLNTIKKYRLKMQQTINETHCKVSWKLIPWTDLKASETIADTEDYWLLTSKQNNNQQTVVKYVTYTDPGEVPIGMGWIVDKLSKDGIPKTIEAVRLKAKKLNDQ